MKITTRPANPNWEMILDLLFLDHVNSAEFEVTNVYRVSKGDELFEHMFECLMGFMENVFPTDGNVFQMEMSDVKSIEYSHQSYSGPVIVIHLMDSVKEPITWEFPNFHQVFQHLKSGDNAICYNK